MPRLTECPDGLYYNSGREVRNVSISTVNMRFPLKTCVNRKDMNPTALDETSLGRNLVLGSFYDARLC